MRSIHKRLAAGLRVFAPASFTLIAGCVSGGGGGGGDPVVVLGDAGAGQGGAGGQNAEQTDGQLGSACGDCVEGLICDTSAPGGYCTAPCQGDCGASGVCYQLGAGAACLRRCAADEECRGGYTCQGEAGSTVCAVDPAGGAGGEGGGGGAGGAAGEGGGGGACDAPRIPDNSMGGCRVRLVTPTECETIDLRGGRAYEFAWTTDGTGCELPWKFIILGTPLSETNGSLWTLSTDLEQGISSAGGIFYLRAGDFDGIEAQGGIYQWTVASFYGSSPEGRQFRILR